MKNCQALCSSAETTPELAAARQQTEAALRIRVADASLSRTVQFFGIDAPAGTTSLSVSDGYFALLKPLSAGTHTLHFDGVIDLSSIGG